jgi:hypothetical protein
VDVEPVDRDGIARTVAAAEELLRHHVPDAGGTCWGCLEWWGRLAPYPCEQARWAAAVRAAYGGGWPAATG